ncbi:S1 family peptidase [Microbacterium sp. G2-8]|uniref:S1 family peptidase n=1 Tax=Microbacterium sp. G2-8 TaxID=2842454 RepID=UPI001C89087A|nr:S1 family peptidase [Microbacterium sp. G2-8]
MSSTFTRSARLGAVGAAAALAAGALLVTPAMAEEGGAPATLDEIAAVAFDAAGVQAVTTDGSQILIKTVPEGDAGEGGIKPYSADATSAEAIAQQYSNVAVQQLPEAIKAFGENDVVGGQGYASFNDAGEGGYCSIGFPAWSPNGDPAYISAGHCTGDGAYTTSYLTEPATDPANGGEGGVIWKDLGSLAFAQFGGPGNSTSQDTSEPLTDIAVFDVTNENLTLKPRMTDWSTASQNDLFASSQPITGVKNAAPGDPLQRSGRTTGYAESEVYDEGYVMVEDRIVKGFGAQITTIPGDSGGSAISNGAAMGVLSGGIEGYSWWADLDLGLDQIRGAVGDYQVMLDIAEPAVERDMTERDGSFTGSAPANSMVTITGDIEAEVPADDSGYFSFPAPNEVGSFDISLVAKQGYNVSEKVNATVKTSEITVDAPGITSPENEMSTTEVVTAITGTGEPGATVMLQGDAEGTAMVADDGTWSVETELGFGAYTVGVTQEFKGVQSEARWVSFQVVPGAPSIATPEDGGTYEEGQLPSVVGESGIEGAMVDVSIEGDNLTEAQLEALDAVGDTEVVGGTWMVDFNEQLAPGTYTVTATQSTAGVTSAAASATFDVVAASEEPGDGNGGGEQPGEGGGDDDELAATGADMNSMLPLAGGAAVALLAGGALLALRRAVRA